MTDTYYATPKKTFCGFTEGEKYNFSNIQWEGMEISAGNYVENEIVITNDYGQLMKISRGFFNIERRLAK